MEQLTLENLSGFSPDQYRRFLEDFKVAFQGEQDPEKLQEVFGAGALHPDSLVRRAVLDIADAHIHRDCAVELIRWATHDTDDFVCFRSVQLCKKHHLTQSVQDLFPIIGRPSERIGSAQIPVGMGHEHVLDALLSLLGTDNPTELKKVEDFFFLNGRLPSDDTSLERPVPNVDDMVHIPSGYFTMGMNEADVPFKRFDTSFYLPLAEHSLTDFHMDKYPVTNAEYDHFVSDVDVHGHRFCHPDEPINKVHRRNTFLDYRFQPDHPVTGIDWYDAYAYAKWLGKDLPTEKQWEKAARGLDGRIYPWGNEFDPTALNWLGSVFSTDIPNIEEWRKLLIQIGEDFPKHTTAAVDAHPQNVSPYGVRDMVGNAWEYTSTNFFSAEDMDPHFKHKDPVNFMQDPGAFVLIKGGPWTGIPEMTTSVFRGKDLFTDRHNEIGFRCVVNSGT